MTRRTTTWTLFAGGPDGIPVEVERKRVRRLNLRVRADGSAHLSVPARCPLAEAQRFLDAHEAWLRDHVRRREPRADVPDDGLVPLWGALVPLPAKTTPDELYRTELAARLPEVAARMEAALARARRAPRASASTFVWRPTRPPASTTSWRTSSHTFWSRVTTSVSMPFSPERTRTSAPPAPCCAAPRASSPPIRAQPLTSTKQTLGKLPPTVSERMSSMSRLAHIALLGAPAVAGAGAWWWTRTTPLSD